MSRCCCPDPNDEHDEISNSSGVGPKKRHHRHCTDVFCLLFFVLFLSVSTVLAVAILRVGDPERLSYGVDYHGNVCGHGEHTDAPYIYYPRLGLDLLEHKKVLSQQPWLLANMLYGICVAACPAQGGTVVDSGCKSGQKGCKWEPNELVHGGLFSSSEKRGEWEVSVGTQAILNRCIPVDAQKHLVTTLCAYPDCKLAGRPCYTESYPEENYWHIETAEELQACSSIVNFETTRSFSAPGSTLVTQFVAKVFGGFFGVVGDVSHALPEIATIGVLAAIVFNFICLVLLRYFVRFFFFVLSAALVLLLIAINLVLFARAGVINVPSLAKFLGEWSSDRLEQLGTTLSSMGDLGASLSQEVQKVDSGLDTLTPQLEEASSSALFDRGDASAETYLYAALVTSLMTVLAVLLICLVYKRLEVSLAICKEATRTVFANKALLLLPLVSVWLSVVAIVLFFLVLAFALTPDPESITSEIDSIAEGVGISLIDAVNAAIGFGNAGLDAVQDGVAAVDKFEPVKEAVDGNKGLGDAIDQFEEFQFGEMDKPGHWMDSSQLLHYNQAPAVAAVMELVSTIWFICFVDAVVYATIAGTVFYHFYVGRFKDRDVASEHRQSCPMLQSLYTAVRYHLGSLAMGAFVLALVKLIRIFMLWLDAQAKELQQNSFLARVVFKCVHCVLFCFEKCIKFLTSFAYIYVAVDGVSFCSGAVRTYKLVVNNPLQLVANESALAILSLLMTCITPLACGSLAYLAIAREWRVQIAGGVSAYIEANLHDGQKEQATTILQKFKEVISGISNWAETGPPDPLVVAVATVLISFWVTQMFRLVYAAAVQTLTVCVLRDKDYHGGEYSSAQHKNVFIDGQKHDSSLDKEDFPQAGPPSPENRPRAVVGPPATASTPTGRGGISLPARKPRPSNPTPPGALVRP